MPAGATPLPRLQLPLPWGWQPLDDAEWDALLPFVLVRDAPGRFLRDARRRLDAVFRIAAAGRKRIPRCLEPL